jgi:methyl-accepting chemotaxis protein
VTLSRLSEGKALAEQTAKATREIGQQVAGIQNVTGESVSAIMSNNDTIEKRRVTLLDLARWC